MAFLSISHVAIRGVVSCVPSKIDENLDAPVFAKGEAERVIAQTGIERKHVVADNMVVSDLFLKAAEQLLAELHWEKDSVDVLGVVSLSPDYLEPPTACIMQDRLKLSESCFTIDMNQGCPGWINGLATLSSLLSHGSMRRAILLNGDASTLLNSPYDKECRPLFGDAGVATALEFDNNAPDMQFDLGTRGKDFKAIWRKAGGLRVPITEDSLKMKNYGEHILRRDTDCVMDGMNVFAFGISVAPKSVKHLCEHFNIDLTKTDKFLMHQANLYMNSKIRKKLKIPEDKTPMCLKDYGNTSSASIPLTMTSQCHKEYASGRLDNIACAFGVGLAWGSVHFVTDHIICPEPIIY